MVKERHVTFSTMNQTASAARFLYETVLGHDRTLFHIPMAKVPVIQPELLSREEIARLFAVDANPVYRMILQTIYATGLRVFEACEHLWMCRQFDPSPHTNNFSKNPAQGFLIVARSPAAGAA
jgi:site-specific recombinase XerD